MARQLARRSRCSRDQVAALVVDSLGKVIGEGYNGPPRGYDTGWYGASENVRCDHWCPRAMHHATIIEPEPPQADYSDCPALHAEANALMMSDRSLREDGTIYVTSHICFSCAKLIANSGISLVYVEATQSHEHRRAQASYDFLKNCGLSVIVTEVAE